VTAITNRLPQQEVALLVGLRVTSRRSQHELSPPDGDLLSAEESLEELAALAATAGARVAETSIQTRSRIDPATLVGSGKVDELKAQIQFHEATTLIVIANCRRRSSRTLKKRST
jgi:GTPase